MGHLPNTAFTEDISERRRSLPESSGKDRRRFIRFRRVYSLSWSLCSRSASQKQRFTMCSFSRLVLGKNKLSALGI